MPTIEVTREELEALIDSIMHHRINTQPDCVGGMPYIEMLSNLHLKLEENLELWINGGTVQLPIPETLKNKGVVGYERVYPPHDEGFDRHGE